MKCSDLTRNKGLTGIGDEYHTYQGKRILIVHVGKAAGGTVNKALLTAGVRSRQIHMHALDAQMIDEHDCILLCLRNPVQRTISAFNWRVPGGRNVSEGFAFKQCGIGNYEEFYTCCRSIEEYAARLSEFSTCGSIARQGECHTELDTCAYVGGVVHELERQRSKVFAIDTSTIQSDLNTISRHLGWGKRFDRLPRIHEYEKKINLTQLSATGLKSITTFVEVTGEASLYRKLLSVFKLQQ